MPMFIFIKFFPGIGIGIISVNNGTQNLDCMVGWFLLSQLPTIAGIPFLKKEKKSRR